MPQYDLEDVRTAVKNGCIGYHGRKVSRDISNLGYELADVSQCLLSLTTTNFRKTHQYGDGPKQDDYVVTFPRPDGSGDIDTLYIKFFMVNNNLLIKMASFHV